MLDGHGKVLTQYTIDADPQYGDVWFTPSPALTAREALGVVGRLTMARCLLEVYRKTPNTDDLRAEVEKGLTLSRKLSGSRAAATRIKTWVISPGQPRGALVDLGFEPDTEIVPTGIYQMPQGLCLGLVVVNELPVTKDTLFLRLFGRAKHQQRALRELFDRKEDSPLFRVLWALVMRWRITVQNKPEEKRADWDNELLDNVAWLEEYERKAREAAIAEGREEGLEKGLEEGLEKGLEEGIEKGREQGEEVGKRQLSDLMVEERLGRPLSPAERQGLYHLLSVEGPKAVVRLTLTSSPEALSARLASSAPSEPGD